MVQYSAPTLAGASRDETEVSPTELPKKCINSLCVVKHLRMLTGDPHCDCRGHLDIVLQAHTRNGESAQYDVNESTRGFDGCCPAVNKPLVSPSISSGNIPEGVERRGDQMQNAILYT